MGVINSIMVTYSESNEGLDKMLVDDTCKNIYKDVVNVLTVDTMSMDDKHVKMQELLEKYEHHYLMYYFMGYYYSHSKQYDASLQCYKICINKNCNCMDAYLNLAVLYHKFGFVEETKEVLNVGIGRDPNDLRLLNFIGAIHYLDKDFYIAYNFYKKIINVVKEPTHSLKNIYNNIGFSSSAIGKCKKALNYFNYGLSLKCTGDTMSIDSQLLQNKLMNYDYMYKIPENTSADYLMMNNILRSVKNYTYEVPRTGKLRIGYLSADLRQHVVAYFIDAVLKNYDRNRFEVYCYYNHLVEDAKSKIFQSYPELHWFNIADQNDDTVCMLIKSHGIDVLIDLSGHTNNNRLDVLSKKPAPVQITYLGYPNSTGLTTVDYRITDKYADPLETTQFFSEKLIRMPDCFVCYTPSIDLSTVPVNPIAKPNVRFGVFNKIHKYNKYSYRAWNRIINSVQNSVLVLKKDVKSTRDEKKKCLSMLNLPDNKFEMVEYIKNQQEYCEMYNSIDICLDTFPYSGTTTSCDTLLMGTPIVTLNIPNRHVSNVTSSFLINMGFGELVAHSMEEYIKIAVDLANSPERIAYYKKNIRDKFIELMNPIKFAKEFDNLIYTTYMNHNEKYAEITKIGQELKDIIMQRHNVPIEEIITPIDIAEQIDIM